MVARISAETPHGAGAPYLPFAGGGFRLAMGLMPLAPEWWFEIDEQFVAVLAEKRALLDTRHDAVFAALPEAEAPASELLALVAPHLATHHADVFSREGDILVNRATGERWNVMRPVLHPLDLCGRLVQEDFCLLMPGSSGALLVGASLSAPSRWTLAEKLGRPLVAVHGNVPGYAEALDRSVARFFEHLKPGRLVWRLNWGIHDNPARFQPVRPPELVAVTAADAGAQLWLRVERQTLRKLGHTGAIVFTIRTYVTPLGRAVASAKDAADLASALRAMPHAMLDYKGIADFAEPLLAWLDGRATMA